MDGMVNKKKRTVTLIIIFILLIVIIILTLFIIRKLKKTDTLISVKDIGEELQEQSYWRTDSHRVCKAESGYYYLQYDDNKMLTMIRYMDGNTHKTTPVCAKAECMHDSSDCNAMLGNDYMSTQIHYYKGNIYVIRVDNGMAEAG